MYVFLGTEYGIQIRYASIISSCFENRCIEYDSFSSLEAFLSTKHIVPVKPSLFIVRYDEKFASSLDESVSRRIDKLKVPGCIVLIYQNSRYESKIDKYLGKYSVEISSVSPDVMKMYLSKEFDSVPISLINQVAQNEPIIINKICDELNDENIQSKLNIHKIELSDSGIHRR